VLCGEQAVIDTIEILIEDLYSLSEPWRGRFLDLVAHLATGDGCGERAPEREQLVNWLWADPRLCREVKLLLDSWPGSSA
jgi:hypothetical protein